MNPRRILAIYWRRLTWRFVFFSSVIALIGYPFVAGSRQNPAPQSTQDVPRPIFSDRPNDPWNRIFFCLFTRRFEARVSDEYPEGAPFAELHEGILNLPLRVSTRSFERLEIGDRAIDPLYPNFLVNRGIREALIDPKFSALASALQDALNDNTPRFAVARALMQSDLWSAYDQLFREFRGPNQTELEKHRQALASLLGRLIRKVALTPNEVRTLPANYSAAMRRQSLPDIFNKNSGWIEIQWQPHREHEFSAGERRVARIFIKPTHASPDLQRFKNGRYQGNNDPDTNLDGVALITQLLLIDSRGDLTPTTLTTEVQFRLFERTSGGAFKRTNAEEAEVSRRLFISDPSSGGLAAQAEDSPAYLPSAGNDYAFASPQFNMESRKQEPPVQVHLRTRCAACHGDDLATLWTFNLNVPPSQVPYRLRQLDPSSNQEADEVISRKDKQEEFKSLRAYFEKPLPAPPASK